MAQPPAFDEPWSIALFAILADGEWYDYTEILEYAAAKVSRQLGWEKGEYYRRSRYERQCRPVPPRKDGRDDETTRTGQRVIVSRTIRMMAYHGLVKIDYEKRSIKRKTPTRISLTQPQITD